ncbi:lasso peptide biosynthesis PqqD family chaperone [Streptomyces sp. PSKA30]|uniref:lasso peptide biosynthesis PqqD family chaperone n=1 Tax=Streptomyces sp. PSKA30 TaxID=2874597 RepID=UPI001CD0DC5A|nr:lasso peptide biosynthesis PqqD family chaperone [Streptomyces sp. PSKA30]MBZ9644373.1 lasso peptide biosynthesis PqqD family chaperone [Streptomyces sp. PSKA30]
MLKPSPDVVLTKNQDAAVLLDKRSGSYYRLNPLAVVVFERISAGRSEDAVVTELQTRFPDDRERIPGDVARLVAALRSAHILVAA